ncbi:MAG: CBS domain-containing protein [bacterium]|nr:CBS domain-containing protein [bacterium]
MDILRRHIYQRLVMSRVAELHPNSPFALRPDDPLIVALEIMKSKRIGSILVTDNVDKLVGIVTEKDIIHRVFAQRVDIDNAPVSTVMTRDPKGLRRSASVGRVIYLMSNGHYRHVPIVDEFDYPLGIVSIKDVLTWLVKCLDDEVETEENVNELRSEVDFFLNSYVSSLNLAPPEIVSVKQAPSEVVRKMRDQSATGVLVADMYGRLLGMFTERDYIVKAAALKKPLNEWTFDALLTYKPQTARMDTPLKEILQMLGAGYRHVPIVDLGNKPVALVSLSDIVSHLSESLISDLVCPPAKGES